MTSQYKSLLGLTEVIADSAEISNIDLSATNITGLTTTNVSEGTNLYFTNARVNINPNVSSNTTHRDRTDNPHGVTATHVGIEDTDDISEGVTNLYYTDIRFDDRLATKTTTSLTEGTNLYYTDARFDTRLATKTTDNLTEGTNLYYTDGRFDTRLAIKTTTDLTEGTNLYYTDARFDARLLSKTTTDLAEGTNLYYTDVRFDTRLLSKTTTDLTEGANLYYTDARFDTRFAIKTTTDLTEGSNLYYTDARFDARLAIKTTTDLTEGTNLYYTTARANTDFDARLATKTTTDLTEGTNLYYTEARVSANTDVKANTAKVSADGSIDTHSDVSILTVQDQQFLKYSSFTQKWANVTPTTAMIAEHNNLYYTDARFDTRLATKTTDNLAEGTNLYYTEARFDTSFGVKKTTDLTEGINLYYTEARVSANTDVNANTAYRNTGHLPLAGGTLTGNLNMGNQDIDNVNQIFVDRKSVANNKLVLWDNGTPSTTAFYGFGIQSGTLLYNVDTSGANHKFYYAGTNELFRIGDAGVYSYRNSNITGDLTVSGEINIGGAKIARGATNGLQLYGASSNLSGPHIQAFVSTDTYPVFQQLNWSHNNVNMVFDAYYDGSWRSSSTSSNLLINKDSTSLNLMYDSGIALGGSVTFNTGFSMNTINGLVSCNNGLHVIGNITVSGTVDGVDLEALETAVSANTAKVSYPTADSTKVGFISVTQAVNLDTMESDIATNTAKVSYPTADSTKVGFISVTQAVNLDTMESDIATNTAKVSYPSADSTKVGFISVTQAVNLDTMESDIATNTAKVSYTDSAKVGLITVTQAVNLDTMGSDIATNTAKVSYPSADSTKVGFISVTQAVNLDTMESNIASNNTYRNVGHLPLSGGTMTGDITMGGQVPTTYNGPTMTSNNTPAPYVITVSSALDGDEYLAFDGKNYNAWYSSVNTRYNTTTGIVIGTPYPRLISGTNYYGEWIQVDLGANYIIPSYSIDPSYTSGGAPKSWAVGVSTNGSTFTLLDRKVDQTYGSYTTFTPTTPMIGRYIVMSIDRVSGNAGRAIITVLSYTYETLNYSIYNLKEPSASHYAATKGYVDSTKLSLSGGTMTGNLNMGNQDIDNVNQIFVNRSGLANNKLVLYDGGSGSTTAFYGLGIQSSTLLYNVDGTGPNHKFYYSGTNELFRIGNAGVYSYRNLDVTGNITVSGTVDGIDIQALNTTVGGKLSLAGGGVITNGSIDIYTQARSGSHGTVKGLYVTSDFGQYSSGAEFRHSNGTQGTGIGYAGIYACGSNGSQNLSIVPKGTTGDCYVISSGGSSLKLGKRSAVTGEPIIALRRNGDGGEACLGYGGNLYAWVTTNKNNTPVGGYTYLQNASGVWVNASDRRLKCDIVDFEIKDCCTKICLLKPRNYRWKRDEKKNNNIGFIADEVKEVYPELVSSSGMTIEGDENIEGVNYTGMIPILVGSIQSILAEVKALKAEVELLKNPV